MTRQTIQADTAAEAYLTLLADRGVDYLFGNAGTDFASIIEALSKAQLGEAKAPTPVTVPHENVAVAMAHGYYLMTGKPQAVMLHVSVGTANGICGVLNASRDRVPLLFSAGRTPINEEGPLGARSIYIHWAQEMFDQAGMVREAVKWDYELRNTGQMETIVDRALTLAMTEPRGPVYLTLPREVLAENPGEFSYDSPSRAAIGTSPAPDANAIDQAADWLANAENPMIITASYGRNVEDVAALADLAETHAIPVICYRPRYNCLPTDHPMHMGFEPGGLIGDADVIVVLEADVPWIPSLHKISPDAKIVQIGVDPLYEKYPVRGFPCDLAIRSDGAAAIRALSTAMEGSASKNGPARDARRTRAAAAQAKAAEDRAATIERSATGGPMQLPWVSHCLGQVMGEDDILINESQIPTPFLGHRKPGTFFGNSPAAGLGWGTGASLGVKLAARDRRVIASIGDGAYMFGNPTPAHFVGASMELPILTLVINNRMWGAVRKATLGLHPDGAASRLNRSPLTAVEPSPEYHKIVEANGGYGERVDNAEDLPGALDRALKAVDVEGRQAVLNIQTAYDDAQALADARR
jgi:acetolactate synthase-1/2/3 large subunit